MKELSSTNYILRRRHTDDMIEMYIYRDAMDSEK